MVDGLQRAERLELLLNLVSALRPDMALGELHELAVNGLLDLSGYLAAMIWLEAKTTDVSHKGETVFVLDTSAGLKPAQRAALRAALIPTSALNSARSELHCLGEALWYSTNTPPPASLQPLEIFAAPDGHLVVMPLVYTELSGLVILVGETSAPDAERLLFIQQCVDQITVALSAADLVTTNLQTRRELEASLAIQAALSATVAEISTPVLPLFAGVLLLPIVGDVDTNRAAAMAEALLENIVATRALVALLDITAVPVVDTQVAAAFINMARSAGLMGCRVIMVGIRPEIAQALVSLGVNLDEVTTRGSLADGLNTALASVGLRIIGSEKAEGRSEK